MHSIVRLVPFVVTLGACTLLATVEIPSPWQRTETLEAQRPKGWEGPFHIHRVISYYNELFVVLAPSFSEAFGEGGLPEAREVGQTRSADGDKVFLDLTVPAAIAQYLTQEEFNQRSLYTVYMPIYSAEEGSIMPLGELQGWAQSPWLGWVYMNHYPWVYHFETRQWLYLGEQQRNMVFDFGKIGSEPVTQPCWFKPFPEWDGLETLLPPEHELYDTVLFHIWSPRSGWLITDANLYPYCWSEAIGAWMLHGPATAEPWSFSVLH